MDARLQTIGEKVEAPLDERMLANMSVATLMTRFGPFDVLFEPAGGPPCKEMKQRSGEVRAYGVVVRAADIEDIIAMKRARRSGEGRCPPPDPVGASEADGGVGAFSCAAAHRLS